MAPIRQEVREEHWNDGATAPTSRHACQPQRSLPWPGSVQPCQEEPASTPQRRDELRRRALLCARECLPARYELIVSERRELVDDLRHASL